MGEQLKMLTRTVLVCLLVSLSYRRKFKRMIRILFRVYIQIQNQKSTYSEVEDQLIYPAGLPFKLKLQLPRGCLMNLTVTKGELKNGFDQRSEMPTKDTNITPWTHK